MIKRHGRVAVGAVAILALVAAACSSSIAATGGGGECKPAETPVLTLASSSNVYDVCGKLISNFQSEWRASTRRSGFAEPVPPERAAPV